MTSFTCPQLFFLNYSVHSKAAMAAMPPPKYVPVLITSLAVAVLEFSLGGGALGWRHFHLGGTQLILSC